MIITISGVPGSGKTTIGKMLAKKLGYRFYSMGDIRGKLAKSMGMTIDEFNRLGEKEDWTDKRVDDYQRELGKKEDNIIVEGRLSFHFIPHSVKIFLYVDPRVAAKRIFLDQREDEKRCSTEEEVLDMLKKRMESDARRYRKYYNVDYLDRSNYDLVVDTTNLKKEEVLEKILDFISERGCV